MIEVQHKLHFQLNCTIIIMQTRCHKLHHKECSYPSSEKRLRFRVISWIDFVHINYGKYQVLPQVHAQIILTIFPAEGLNMLKINPL